MLVLLETSHFFPRASRLVFQYCSCQVRVNAAIQFRAMSTQLEGCQDWTSEIKNFIMTIIFLAWIPLFFITAYLHAQNIPVYKLTD